MHAQQLALQPELGTAGSPKSANAAGLQPISWVLSAVRYAYPARKKLGRHRAAPANRSGFGRIAWTPIRQTRLKPCRTLGIYTNGRTCADKACVLTAPDYFSCLAADGFCGVRTHESCNCQCSRYDQSFDIHSSSSMSCRLFGNLTITHYLCTRIYYAMAPAIHACSRPMAGTTTICAMLVANRL